VTVGRRLIPLKQVDASRLVALAVECEPFIRPRGESDYWLYGRLFSTTCKAIVEDETAVAFIVAFRGQDDTDELYIQDVAVGRDFRQRGHGRLLVEDVVATAKSWGVSRVWLTSEPENTVARDAWRRMGFVNPPADRRINGIWVTAGLKGPGHDRAVFERRLR
jgi:ribosomal protein S18 acetylase RimI-like enzyme